MVENIVFLERVEEYQYRPDRGQSDVDDHVPYSINPRHGDLIRIAYLSSHKFEPENFPTSVIIKNLNKSRQVMFFPYQTEHPLSFPNDGVMTTVLTYINENYIFADSITEQTKLSKLGKSYIYPYQPIQEYFSEFCKDLFWQRDCILQYDTGDTKPAIEIHPGGAAL